MGLCSWTRTSTLLTAILAYFSCPALVAVTLQVPAEYATVLEALTAAAEGDEVLLAPGVYTVHQPILIGTKSLTLRASSEASPAVLIMSQSPIDPSMASVVQITGLGKHPVVLEGLTITGGSGNGFYGGGLSCDEGAIATLRRCLILNNQASAGGGVHASKNSSLIFEDCEFAQNIASTGAAISTGQNGAELVFRRCNFRDNGEYSEIISGDLGSTIAFEQCRFERNRSPFVLNLREGNYLISECRFLSNVATPILCNLGASVRISDSVIALNRGELASAVSIAQGCSVQLDRCTIVGNIPHGTDTDSVLKVSPDVQLVTVSSCIIWGNIGQSFNAPLGDRVAVKASLIQGETVHAGEGNLLSDPLFCGWGSEQDVFVDIAAPAPGAGTKDSPFHAIAHALDYSYRLLPMSPCIGAGVGGVNMGAPEGVCDIVSVSSRRTVHLGPGVYNIGSISAALRVGFQGSGRDRTVLKGSIGGLRTGEFLRDLEVTEALDGGLYVCEGDSPEILRCVFRENCGSYGAGIRSFRASPQIKQCTIERNYAHSGPGGIAIVGGSVNIDRCIVEANYSSTFGVGGVSVVNAEASIQNCLIVGNYGAVTHSGLEIIGGDWSLRNCTIADNFTRPEMFECYLGQGGRVIVNNIIWTKTGKGGLNNPLQVAVPHCVVSGERHPGGNQVRADPEFRKPATYDFDKFKGLVIFGRSVRVPDFIVEAGDYQLSSSSLALDFGSLDQAPVYDLQGVGRPCNGGVDIGTYEQGGCPPFLDFVRGDVNDDGVVNLTDAVAILAYLFLGGSQPRCLKAADVTDSGQITLTDAVAILQYLFLGGGAPSEPWPVCDQDGSADSLSCTAPSTCAGAVLKPGG